MVRLREKGSCYMKVIKNINNNVSLCLDSKGREVIAFGKGLGFIKPPYEIPLSKIDRTFYNIKDTNFEGIKHIPASTIQASIKIVDEVECNLNVKLMSTAALSLADHINFAIQRLQQHILLEMTVQEDLKQLYPKEMKEAYRALDIIKEETGITLDQSEAGTIALHFINNQVKGTETNKVESKDILDPCVAILEQTFHLTINRDSFNYSRFATHVDYLLKRTLANNQLESANSKMYETLKNQYPKTYRCALAMNDVLKQRLSIDLNEEEQLYLMLHINRICAREVETV